MRVLGEPVPHLVEGEQALGPRAQEQRILVAGVALGEANVQPVDRPVLRLDSS